jgi:hypothetical protein
MSKKEKGKYKFGDLIIKPTMQKLTKDKDYQVGDLTKSLLPNDVRKKVVGSDTAEVTLSFYVGRHRNLDEQ